MNSTLRFTDHDRVRVLQLLPSITAGGGAEQSLVMMAPLLRERGIDVEVAFMIDRGDDLTDALRRSAIPVHDLSGAKRMYPDWALRIRRLVRKIEPHVLHSTLFDVDISARIAGLTLPVNLLSTWASTTYDPLRKRLEPGAQTKKAQVARVLDTFSAHVSRSMFHAVTDGVARDGMKGLHISADRVFVVERGRDFRRFQPQGAASRAVERSRIGVSPEDIVIMTVARQVHAKGHVFLLRAFDKLAADYPNLKLILIGPPGSASPAIAEELNHTRFRNLVVDLGGRNDVESLLCAADVFVLSSIREGAAGAILEAMSSQVPVAATRLTGLTGCIEDEQHALLANPGDHEDLARVISSIIDNPLESRARAMRAREHVVTRFSLERSADGMADMYRMIANNTRM